MTDNTEQKIPADKQQRALLLQALYQSEYNLLLLEYKKKYPCDELPEEDAKRLTEALWKRQWFEAKAAEINSRIGLSMSIDDIELEFKE